MKKKNCPQNNIKCSKKIHFLAQVGPLGVLSPKGAFQQCITLDNLR